MNKVTRLLKLGIRRHITNDNVRLDNVVHLNALVKTQNMGRFAVVRVLYLSTKTRKLNYNRI